MQELLDADAIVVDGRPVGKSHRLVEGTVIELLDEPDDRRAARGRRGRRGRRPLRRRRRDRRGETGGPGRAPGRRSRRRHARERAARAVSRDRDGGRPDAARASCTGSTATRAGCWSSRARRARTTRWSRQIATRTVDRRYVALGVGRHRTRRAASSTRRSAGRPRGARAWRCARRARPARTEYEVRTRLRRAGVLAARLPARNRPDAPDPRAPRRAIGHPIVGDATYGGARDAIRLGRPFLHASELAFDQPATGERLAFADALPPELAAVLTDLAARA